MQIMLKYMYFYSRNRDRYIHVHDRLDAYIISVKTQKISIRPRKKKLHRAKKACKHDAH